MIENLEGTVATKIEEHPIHKKAADARAALAPIAEKAQAILGELQMIQATHGSMISKLVNLDIPALEKQMGPLTGEGARRLAAIDRLAKGTHELLYGAGATLEKVPRRITDLTDAS